ncbi:elongation factor P 5-aminopentanone reductase [Anoxybacillus eryuanensis]|uniref:elongation factor P 5-aminopentanone reductase n=1 Tax=Anoxybacillus eryuanensis TaxID=651866 RepID=UPI003EF9A286
MKYALITGASGGIGQAIARQLAKDGYGLYLHYYKNEQSVQTLVKQLSTDIYTIQADLSHPSGVDVLVSSVFHPLDVIVHNSGMSAYGLVTDMDDEQVERMVQLHVTSPFLLTKRLLPSMIQQRRGQIVVISSIWGLTGASCEVLYSMVKGAQNTFVKALAKEVAPSGIRVNAIAPGAIDTPMLHEFTEEELEALTNEIPLGRIGKPEDVAKAVSFLISDHASYITGQILSVNGGWYC